MRTTQASQSTLLYSLTDRHAQLIAQSTRLCTDALDFRLHDPGMDLSCPWPQNVLDVCFWKQLAPSRPEACGWQPAEQLVGIDCPLFAL